MGTFGRRGQSDQKRQRIGDGFGKESGLVGTKKNG